MSRLNYSTTTAARSRVVKVWIALRNNPGEKDLLRDVASCGQLTCLIGREMHGEKGNWTFSQSGATFQRFLSRFSEEVDQVLVFRELLGIIQRCFSVYIGQKGVGSILQQKLADFYPLVTAHYVV